MSLEHNKHQNPYIHQKNKPSININDTHLEFKTSKKSGRGTSLNDFISAKQNAPIDDNTSVEKAEF